MQYTASWADVTVPLFIDDEALKCRAEQFLDLDISPASSDEAAAMKVRRVTNGWEFSADFGPPFLEHDDDAVMFLTMLIADAFEQRTPCPVLHAGAFDAGAGAVVFLAPTAEGKSSLTLAAWRRGYSILGDDRIALMITERTVQPVPRCLKLRIENDHVPGPWIEGIPASETLIGGFPGDRRWMLSRRLPRMADCDKPVAIKSMAQLRRIDEGPSHVDKTPLSAVIQSALDYATLGSATPMDLLRFLKRYTDRGKLRRVNVAPGDIERGVDLLVSL